jgi:hypothetical protein
VPAQVLARTLRPPWPPAQSSSARQGHSPACSVHGSPSQRRPSWTRTRASSTGRRRWRREPNREVKRNGSKGTAATRRGGARTRRSPRRPLRRRTTCGAQRGHRYVACSDELVCVQLTALTRVVADSTAPPCLPAVVAVVLCLELVAYANAFYCWRLIL